MHQVGLICLTVSCNEESGVFGWVLIRVDFFIFFNSNKKIKFEDKDNFLLENDNKI